VAGLARLLIAWAVNVAALRVSGFWTFTGTVVTVWLVNWAADSVQGRLPSLGRC
jgi:hypothetical protein